MSSDSGISAARSSLTDLYAHCHSIPSIESGYADFETTEKTIVEILTKNKTATTINGDEILSDYEVVKVEEESVNQIMPICYPYDAIEKDAVLASVFKNNEVTFDSTSVTFPDSNVVSTLSVNETSTSIYDSIVRVKTTIEPVLYSTNDAVEVTFDLENEHAALQYAVNSQYNTKLNIHNMDNANVYTTYVEEDTDYNTEKAFGKNYGQYISSIDTEGKPVWTSYSGPSIEDKFVLTDNIAHKDENDNVVDFNNNDNIGIFKVSVFVDPKPFKTDLFLGENSQENVVSDSTIKTIPLFHETNSLSNENQEKLIDTNPNANVDNSKFLLPSTDLSQEEMLSLIHSTNTAIMQPNFSFKVEISSNEDSGYSFADTTYDLVSIDDSELKDSLIYMKDWVDHDHSLTLTEGNLSLALDTNGMSSVIEEDVSFARQREKLPSGKAGVDGIISLNSHTLLTRHNTLSQSTGNNTQVAVYYTNETIPEGLSKVDDELCINRDVSFGWQKVMQATSVESSTHFLRNANTTLNLVSGDNIINESFDSDINKFSYAFNSNNLPSESTNNNVELWKITSGLNLLSEPNKIVSDEDEILEGLNSSVVLKSATRAFNDEHREIRQQIKLKTQNQLNITSNIESRGWGTGLTEGTILQSSSTSAYSVIESLPTYDLSLFYGFMTNANTNTIPYKLEYKTTNEASQLGSLSDFFEISYTYNGSEKKFIIVENEMETLDLIKQDGQNVDVPLDEYSFVTTGTPVYTQERHKLVKNILRSTYRRRFKFPLGQYDNYELTTPLIRCETISYTVFVRLTDTPVSGSKPSSLSRVRDTNNGGSYSKVYQTVTPVDSDDHLIIEGNLSKQDLKEVYVTTQSKNNDTNTWDNISEPVESSVFYSLEDEPIINDIKLEVSDVTMPGSNNVETILYVTEYEQSNNTEIVVKLNRPFYTIPLVIDYSANVFTLETFRTSLDRNELNNKTTLCSSNNDITAEELSEELSAKVLNIDNLYNVIDEDSWVHSPSDYKIVTSIVGNNITIKVVKSSDEQNAIITLEVKDNYIFVGTFLVSNIKKDVIRKRSLIGNEFEEVFVAAEPDMSSFTITNGVYVNKINTAQLLPLGAYQLFNLKQDLLNYNLVGGSLGSSYESITSLGPFQWEEGEAGYYSDSFSLMKYRGYGHSSNTLQSSSINQDYTIVRPAINATFMITKPETEETFSQTYENIYAGQEVVVDELKRNSNDTHPSDIGLKLTFNYSMPDDEEERVKPVDVEGDNVTIKIENPLLNQGFVYNDITGRDTLRVQTSVGKTLKDYNIYTFDGESHAYRYYSGPMRIRSSRVKLLSNHENNEFTDDKMIYSIKWKYSNDDTLVIVSKATITNPENDVLNFVGDPEVIGVNEDSSWEDVIKTMSLSQAKETGVNIGVHNIKLKGDAEIVPIDYYYVSSPAYYKYETMSTANNITLPYNYASQFVSNRVTRYVPYMTKDDVTPFRDITYSDMLNNPHAVVTNNEYVNDNMTFKIRDPREYADLHFEPSNVKNEIKFFGSHMKIDILKNNNDGLGLVLVKSIYDDYITDLVNDLDNHITLVPSEIDSGIKFMIRQPISQIGYNNDEEDDFVSYYNTTDKSKWFQFKFTLSNVNMFSQTDMTFNMLAGPGTYPLLYTVKDLLSYDSPEILYRRVYKYESDTCIDPSMDFDSDLQPMKTSLLFRTRKYLDIPASMLSSSNNFNLGRFSDMLESITIPSSIQWENDCAFNNLNTNVKVSLLYGDTQVSKDFRRECFYVNDTETVFTLIHYSPFITMVNQVGMPLYNVQWNGLLKVPEVLSESFVLSNGRSRNVITSDNMTTELAKYTNLRL